MDDSKAQPSDSDNRHGTSAAALRELEQRAQAALAATRQNATRLEAEITSQLEQIASTLRNQDDADNEAAALQAEIARLRAELEESRAAWAEERASLETARDALADQLAKQEASERCKEEWQNQLAQFEEKLKEQQTNWNEQRGAWSQERETLDHERDELRQKFDLRLEDVQRLRGRVAELEQELARRPEANEADSAELVALRAERDALSERVEQLERQPEERSDASSEQQVADLQRRFELAVEDVRELKTKNARLEQQLASSGPRPAASDSGAMDWESQKARLLASLEDAGDDGDPVHEKERATIESTIEMTDAIVSQKDHEIADLKARLAAGSESTSDRTDAEREQKVAEIVNADEVVAEHRKRIAQLEREIEEKLRAAELELSVERAKIARQKSELEDLRVELESQRHAAYPNGTDAVPGAPRRRWLAKLGLSGEEQ